MSMRVGFDQDGPVGHIRLLRADAHNAIDTQWVQDLHAAVGACEAAQGVRALLISADGPSFTVGGDLGHIGGHEDGLQQLLVAMVEPFHDALARLSELPFPVVAAVQGPCAGGGIGVMWAADIVIAAEDLKLATGFAMLGLSGDGGSSFYLPRLAGTRRALEIVLENRVVGAEQALEWGLISRIATVDGLAAEARRTVERLAAGPTVGLGEIRRLLRTSSDRTLRQQLAAELEAMKRTAGTRDAPHGVLAFTNKQRPVFEGR